MNSFEMPGFPVCWLLYADPEVAPLRRSQGGSITPIRHWRLYADPDLAPIRRSLTPSHDEEELNALREALRIAHDEITRADKERTALRNEVRLLKAERDLLKERLNARIRELFAAKSEARGTDQRDFFFNEAEALAPDAATPGAAEDEEEVEVKGHKRAKRGRKPLDPNLPRETVRIELPQSDRVCPHDGAALVEIGVEASEQYHVIPQQVRVLRTERVKYACPCCNQGMRTAALPPRIIPKGVLSEATLAWVITSKYQDALPLYRQAALLARFGGEISRNTLAANVIACGEAVQPIINLIRDSLFDQNVVYGDETEVQVLKEPGRAAQRKSYMWIQATASGPPIRLLSYSPTRSGAFARELYAGIQPGTVLLTDGYDGYDAMATAYRLVHHGCWVHARRGFVKALDALPKQARTPEQPAARMIAAIAELYRLEVAATDKKFSVEERLQMRREQSSLVVQRIESLLLANLHAVLPGSELGKALHYLAGQWPKLVRFLDRGDVGLGRVETWRGGRRSGLSVCRPFRLAVPEYPRRSSVSTSPSSNRTCRFPASGSLPMHQTFAFERS
jgi:Transposase and inactivated derivatives